jgi:hypothetical protein
VKKSDYDRSRTPQLFALVRTEQDYDAETREEQRRGFQPPMRFKITQIVKVCGAASRTRTCDPRITKAKEPSRKAEANQLLIRQSYIAGSLDPSCSQTDEKACSAACLPDALSRGKTCLLDLRHTQRSGRLLLHTF